MYREKSNDKRQYNKYEKHVARQQEKRREREKAEEMEREQQKQRQNQNRRDRKYAQDTYNDEEEEEYYSEDDDERQSIVSSTPSYRARIRDWERRREEAERGSNASIRSSLNSRDTNMSNNNNNRRSNSRNSRGSSRGSLDSNLIPRERHNKIEPNRLNRFDLGEPVPHTQRGYKNNRRSQIQQHLQKQREQDRVSDEIKRQRYEEEEEEEEEGDYDRKIEINDKIEAPIGEEIDEIKMMIMITSKMWILIIMTTIIANENLQGNNAIALIKDWKREDHERKAVEMIITITIILIIRKIIIA